MPCDHQFVAVQEYRTVTFGGVLSVILILAALGLCLVNLIAGLVLLVIAILIGAVGRKKSVIKCAKCGEPSPQQAG